MAFLSWTTDFLCEEDVLVPEYPLSLNAFAKTLHGEIQVRLIQICTNVLKQ